MTEVSTRLRDIDERIASRATNPTVFSTNAFTPGHPHGAHEMVSAEETLFVNVALGLDGELSTSPITIRIPCVKHR
jgi:hypothetical protein